MGFLKKMFGGDDDGSLKPPVLSDVKLGTGQPIMLSLSDGVGRFRVFGTYSLSIADRKLFVDNCCDPDDDSAMAEQKNRFSAVLSQLVSDELGIMAAGSSAQALTEGSEVLQVRLAEAMQERFVPLGLRVDILTVDGIAGS